MLLCVFITVASLQGQAITDKATTTADSLSETKWKAKVNRECYDYYVFPNESLYVEYSCELDEEFYGRYVVRGDTLVLKADSGQYNGPVENNLQKLLLKQGVLIPVFMRYDKSKPKIEFEPTYIFRKDTTKNHDISP